jgi:hypothetical protein
MEAVCSSKSWCLPTSAHGVTTQKSDIFISVNNSCGEPVSGYIGINGTTVLKCIFEKYTGCPKKMYTQG